MRSLIFACLILASLVLPKLWQDLKGPGVRHLSRSISLIEQLDGLGQSSGLLAQPFFYWTKGSQFYVFLSSDGQYILKIPRASKMRESLLDRIRNRKIEKPDLFRSLYAAGVFLPNETALLLVHYGKTKNFPSITCYDRLRRKMTVDLNRTAFALQKRHRLLSEDLAVSNDVDELKQMLTAFLDLVSIEKNLGWKCHDCSFWQNIGYHEGRALRLDVGSYVPADQSFSWQDAVRPVSHWLKNSDLNLAVWFEEEVARRERV